MPVIGTDTIAKNIKAFGDGFLKHVKTVMTEVTADLDKEVTKNMSLSDHTPEELAALGHPYAMRHGYRGIAIHDPYWQVHTQSGKLLHSKESGVVGPTISGGNLNVKGFVRLNNVDASYADAVIWGTSRMIPRDFLSGSLNDEMFKKRASEYLKTNLRDMVLKFRGIETR